MSEMIRVRGARQNNLKNIDVDLPKGKLIAITGVSGSGKSSLAFDTIFAEAQRQLLETFSTYARQRLPRYERPAVDVLGGLATAIVIDQKRVGQTSRSTVGTFTEAWTLLRLLFARCGEPRAGDSNVFSFNRPEGMCPQCNGVGHEVEVDVNRVVAWDRTIREGGIRHPDFKVGGAYHKRLLACSLFEVDIPIGRLSEEALNALLYVEKHKLANHDASRYFNITFEGVVRTIERRWLHKEEDSSEYARRRHEFFRRGPCRECGGTRLNRRARRVKVAGLSITEMGDLEVRELSSILAGVTGRLADPIVPRILGRLGALVRVGAGYLSLNRATGTLSGGESQRLKMARQLGCELEGLIYVLDEPTIGLHPHDVGALLDMLRTIRDKGNTVIVVEHDPAVIQAADYCVDLGPGAGAAGGNVVFSGPVSEMAGSDSSTAAWLSRRNRPNPVGRRPVRDIFPIRKADRHNLKGVSVDIPIGRLVCVTGVAGSGKSTLVNEYFVKQHGYVSVVNQSPVSRSQRSNPATFTGTFDHIRKLFARGREVGPGHFSFNSDGACPECKGMGVLEVEMRFLDAVRMTCPRCKGRRYDNTVLDFTVRGRSIADVLEMSIASAADFFAGLPGVRAIRDGLAPLVEVGLGYLPLGQPLSTVSGGEAQRLKLARELHRKNQIYVLDEPTTGLHMADIDSLVSVFHKLVDQGNSVVVIEHNLDVIRQADWVVDLGPGAGKEGGQIVAQGTPEQVAGDPDSITGRYLEEVL